ncbi:MAG TPA: ParB N-terminal domain-containing protein [bacterium]|jgi:hypothetical protein|nr:ParB N-terminal domain-containing protein [bacterium]
MSVTSKTKASLKINFAQTGGQPGLGGDGRSAAKLRPQRMTVFPKDIRKPDFEDRFETLEAGLDQLAESMKAHATETADGVGNFQPIIIVGAQPPYVLVAGRRRYLAAQRSGLPLAAERYSSMPEEYQRQLRYMENSPEGRNNYSPAELIANVVKEHEAGATIEWLGRAFVRSKSMIDKYVRVGRDKVLRDELRLGLPLTRALALVNEHGEKAGEVAKATREERGDLAHQPAKAGRKAAAVKVSGGANAKVEGRSPLALKYVEGKTLKIAVDLKRLNSRKDKEKLRGFLLEAIQRLESDISGAGRTHE